MPYLQYSRCVLERRKHAVCLPILQKKNSRCVMSAEGQTRSRDGGGEAIRSRHPTGSLTSHPAERTGGVPLWPWPAENNEIAAWHSYEGCWLCQHAVSEWEGREGWQERQECTGEGAGGGGILGNKACCLLLSIIHYCRNFPQNV